jgi:ABC-2 type transport system ATP-binding protein
MSHSTQDTVPAIQTIDVRRIYQARGGRSIGGAQAGKSVVALDGVSLTIGRGEIFGLLGRNGAGKTTLIKILTTLLAPTSGQAFIDGMDVTRDVIKVRQMIAMVSGGEQSGYGILTVREQLWMFAQFYGVPSKVAHRRIDELLSAVGLGDQANQKVYALSTGMRQRMNLCRALVSAPEILFLDEPTVGLDVEASRAVREYVRKWMSENPRRTVLLTTHYMFEADELCDHVAVINHGRIVAEGTTNDLKRGLQEHARFHLEMAEWLPAFTEMLREEFIVPTIASINEAGGRVLALRRIEPTLEEAFVRLVGDEAESQREEEIQR